MHIIEAVFSKNIHEKITEGTTIKFRKRRCLTYENDISAEEEIKGKSARIQIENEHCRRKKSFGSQKGKGKKSFIRVKIVAKELVRCPLRVPTGAVL